jgi:hypothetical protein
LAFHGVLVLPEEPFVVVFTAQRADRGLQSIQRFVFFHPSSLLM